MIREKRIAAFISGGGSTIESIARATTDGTLPHSEVVIVISSNIQAVPEERKRFLNDLRIPLVEVKKTKQKSSQEYGEELLDTLDPYKPNIIGQYGHTP